MFLRRCNISLIIGLVSLFSFQAFPQQTNTGIAVAEDNPDKVLFKPRVNYVAGSSLTFVPQMGSLSAFTLSPVVSIPLSPKLSVEGGIIGSYYYSSPLRSDNMGLNYGSFTGLSVYGSAIYQYTPQLTLYGSAFKQLAGSSPFYSLPKSSYTFGSSYNFGAFSIGVSFQVSEWDNIFSPFHGNGSQGFYSPFERNRISR